MSKGRKSPTQTSTSTPMMSERLIAAAEQLVKEGKAVRGPTSLTGYARSPSEMEKSRLGAQRLKEVLGQIPGYARKAEKQGDDYWIALWESGHRV